MMDGIFPAHPKDLTRAFGLGTGDVSIKCNIDPALFEREREKIFRHAWFNVGRAEDVENPGDFMVWDIECLNTSVIVVRGRDGQIRGFHNMCKHRGNKVVRTGIESGTCKGFSCGFHGWTYDLTGKLVIVPDEDQFFDVDKAKNGLTPIDLDVWEGFIFVSGDPRESLRDYLGEIADLFDGYFDGARRISRYRARVNANWKIVTDAFVEGYHAPFLHGKAYPDQIAWQDNHLAHLLAVNLYDRHRMISIEMNPDTRPTPTAAALLQYAKNSVFSAMSKNDRNAFAHLPPGVNPARGENWAFDAYLIFPSFYIAPTRSMHFGTYHFWPVAVDQTVWQTEHYMFAPRDAADRLAQEFSKAFGRDVQREDLITLENTQTVLSSGGMETMPLSDQEVAVRHGYEVVERLIR